MNSKPDATSLEGSAAVLITRMTGVAMMEFNRPERLNAWGEDISRGLLDGLAECADDPETHVVVITGQGRAFSAGANLKDSATHRTPSVDEFLARSARKSTAATVFDGLRGFPKPLIALVNGYAAGIGCLVTLYCDVILAGQSASFWLPQASLGILPAYGGTARLAHWVGWGRAADIALTGRHVDAAEAERIGLAQRVLPDGDLRKQGEKYARQIASMPPLAMRLTKESLAQAADTDSVRGAAIADIYRFMALTLTADAQSAHNVWRESRDGRDHKRDSQVQPRSDDSLSNDD